MSANPEVARTRQRAMNPQTLQKLRENGSDLRRRHALSNVFHVFSEAHAEPLSVALEQAGYRIEGEAKPQTFEGTMYWVITAMIERVPTLEALGAMTDELVSLTAEFDADYDGWYTEVLPLVS